MVTEEDVRRLALALPETGEKPMYGTPAFYVKARWFARIREEGEVLVLPVATQEDKHELIAADPDVFFTLPHYDGHAIVLVRMPAIGEQETAELLADAWRLRAPGKLRPLVP
ncbi:MmcQ/YjbR family DNA-binding protein [Nonomuraea sp. NPDC050790]|uniref:MmcQ/YjbR family DNA-binding protein n=1 Tax=Nonomuraea sp. NPDC050790 TaxID=3364371 RepID=UPI00378A021B